MPTFRGGFGSESLGSLVAVTLPGPPNFESIAGGDRALEAVIVLALPQALCWSFENHVFHAQFVQLVGTSDRLKSAQALVGREVTATGTHREALTGHDHTAIVFELQSAWAIGR